jgi:hypothetical protein
VLVIWLPHAPFFNRFCSFYLPIMTKLMTLKGNSFRG